MIGCRWKIERSVYVLCSSVTAILSSGAFLQHRAQVGDVLLSSFLAVYDGHEGSDVSQYLANNLHKHIQHAIQALKHCDRINKHLQNDSCRPNELTAISLKGVMRDAIATTNNKIMDRLSKRQGRSRKHRHMRRQDLQMFIKGMLAVR